MATTIIEAPRDQCIEQAASLISQILSEAVQKRGKAVLGIGEGKGLEMLYEQLKTQQIPWRKVHIMMTDERCVALNSLESNYRMVNEHLLKHLVESKQLPAENILPFVYNESHAVKSLLKYQAALDALGGFDLILANPGNDNHIAALFPKHASVQKENIGFFLINNAPEHPTQRMTLSRKLLLKARVGIIFFDKEKTWSMFNDQTKTIIDCPSKLIAQLSSAYVFHIKETS